MHKQTQWQNQCHANPNPSLHIQAEKDAFWPGPIFTTIACLLCLTATSLSPNMAHYPWHIWVNLQQATDTEAHFQTGAPGLVRPGEQLLIKCCFNVHVNGWIKWSGTETQLSGPVQRFSCLASALIAQMSLYFIISPVTNYFWGLLAWNLHISPICSLNKLSTFPFSSMGFFFFSSFVLSRQLSCKYEFPNNQQKITCCTQSTTPFCSLTDTFFSK